MLSQIPCLNKCEITLAAFVWPFPGVCFQMSPQIACMNPSWLHLIRLIHYNVFPNVSSLWEYFDLQGPWRKVLTDLKKSLYTLQADPEKSRDFMLKNPGILIDWKSQDPGIPGILLGPDHYLPNSPRTYIAANIFISFNTPCNYCITLATSLVTSAAILCVTLFRDTWVQSNCGQRSHETTLQCFDYSMWSLDMTVNYVALNLEEKDHWECTSELKR